MITVNKWHVFFVLLGSAIVYTLVDRFLNQELDTLTGRSQRGTQGNETLQAGST